MKLKNILSLIPALFMFFGITWAETVKIGFNVPLTGFAAADGESALNGAKLAVNQANASGGINGKQIELVVMTTRHPQRKLFRLPTA